MAVIPWDIKIHKNKGDKEVLIATVQLDAADTTDNLEISEYSDKTVHISGGTVSLLGSNGIGTPQALHRAHDPTLTFTAVAAEALATIIENPRILFASASAGTNVDIVIVARS